MPLPGADMEADDPAFVLVMDGIDVRDDRPWLLFHQFVAKLRYSSDVWFLQQGLFFVPVNRHDLSLSSKASRIRRLVPLYASGRDGVFVAPNDGVYGQSPEPLRTPSLCG